MYLYDCETKTITSSSGGYQTDGLLVRDAYVRFGTGLFAMRCVFYEPVLPTEKSQIGVVVIHSDQDYSIFPIGGELARRGYRTLCGQVLEPEATLEEKMVDIKHAVEFLKNYPGVTKVVLMGHSGGATLMSAYQSAAEKGAKVYQGDDMLVKCALKEELIPADGIMTLDSNWGNGSMTLFSVDPAVVEENGTVKLDPELDIFNPANGFDPEGSEYSDAFLTKFFAAQGERNNAIAKRALERLHLLEAGKGFFSDDEPFVAAGASQIGPCNKLFPQDLRLLNHSKKPHTLLHKDGSSSEEIIRSVRLARGAFGKGLSLSVRGAVHTTVRSYLTNRAVLAGADYAIRPDGAYGIQWENVFNCTPGNIRHVDAPLLVMGMTGGYEGLAGEEVFENAASADKTVAFVEGAGHNFDNQGRAEFGDTQKVVFDYIDGWLSAPGRFLG